MAHSNPMEFLHRLVQLTAQEHISDLGRIETSVRAANSCLDREDPAIRPTARSGKPGSMVFLKDTDYTVIVPDLHARREFFLDVLSHRGAWGNTVLEDMLGGKAQVVCVGDAFHAERRGMGRWQGAYREYLNGFKHHKHMDAEMTDNLVLLQMLCEVKLAAGEYFHFLKGNHENIANERGEGNYPFMKFVREGEMVTRWMQQFAGDELFEAVYRWEKSLPLVAAGRDFLVAHCEPGRAITMEEAINAYAYDDVIYQLTWVGNGEAKSGSVGQTLQNILGRSAGCRMFGGHRPVQGRYDLRQDGSYVQINTPDRHVVAIIRNMAAFNPDRDIIDLEITKHSSDGGGRNIWREYLN